MRGRRRVCALSVLAVLCGVAPAQAAVDTWSALPGLEGQSVRDFDYVSPGATGQPVYAATGAGAFRATFGTPFSAITSGTANDSLVSGSTVLVATDDGLFRSVSGGAFAKVPPVGAVRSVSEAPGGVLLAGLANGGVHRSVDGGTGWSFSSTGMPSGLTVSRIVWLPSLPDSPVFAAAGSGLYKSTDAGATWSLDSDGIPASAGINSVWGEAQRPSRLYAGTSSAGIWRSLDGGATWRKVDGVGTDAVRNITGSRPTRTGRSSGARPTRA